MIPAGNRPDRPEDEVRVTHISGGEKGKKAPRHSLIPPSVLDELARVYGMGAEKYDDTNYLRGFDWNLSEDSAMRHMNAWRSGEAYDKESGLHHLAHAMFHMAALMIFEWYGLGTDTRIEPGLTAGTLFDQETE